MAEFPVFLVDDDDGVRRSVGFMLKTSGYLVQPFESGDAFLAAVKNLDAGCILLDIRMPGTDGLDVQEQLNDRGVTSPVILMTGHGDIDMAVKAMKAGASDFIEKPFEKADLLEALEQAGHRLTDDDRRHARRDEALVMLNGLTPRERDVLDGLVKGHPNKTIGYDLEISPRTVEIHRANLMHKLEVHTLSDLLRIAFAAGLGSEE
ncbi:response regulator [Altererythrobacter sp. ZODW24]|uniref:response regulator transcription factor n=1 Tax=Altererythrobacter sp. ZODW24 TaxID=2185142 RepID=UPI000DF748C5|nr:response regulator [Altererythrobacter sp. ZODW24]